MKVILEDNSIYENEDYINGVQFITKEDDVFIQIGNLSVIVEKSELDNVLKILG